MVLKVERFCQLILKENLGNMHENRFFEGSVSKKEIYSLRWVEVYCCGST